MLVAQPEESEIKKDFLAQQIQTEQSKSLVNMPGYTFGLSYNFYKKNNQCIALVGIE